MKWLDAAGVNLEDLDYRAFWLVAGREMTTEKKISLFVRLEAALARQSARKKL